MSLILTAAKYANLWHRGQTRKYSGDPYIYHPCRVAGRFILHGLATEESVAAAYLHDVIEDCGITKRQLVFTFGDVVANLVHELTNYSKGLNLSRSERKKIDRDVLAKVSKTAKVIKLLDRIDNLKEIDYIEDEHFCSMYITESISLAEVLKDADISLYRELLRMCDDIIEAIDLHREDLL